jgi:DNA polymerase III subunit epsilon
LNAELKRVAKPPITKMCSVTDTLSMARELHPGKRNTLDALCERYEVDNSARTFHGALMDAELLADVYIAMTRGQDSLAIGIDASSGAGGSAGTQAGQPTKRPATLKVVHANADEVALHTEHIAAIDKASGGKAVWNKLADVAKI